ncbi:hypothetical protein ECEC4439_2776, partial [Escherichia coli EC4439]
MRSLYSGLPTP